MVAGFSFFLYACAGATFLPPIPTHAQKGLFKGISFLLDTFYTFDTKSNTGDFCGLVVEDLQADGIIFADVSYFCQIKVKKFVKYDESLQEQIFSVFLSIFIVENGTFTEKSGEGAGLVSLRYVRSEQ